ncbi:alpha/beta fold hydrolase [Numidum massiliense]|uniref:alpha/beta fold hydrolase n=1 Tax=Numidum massiliense TaxID=1522315 RepID=UPI0006D54E1D|nr:alpha/beta hydrolase [Numidum massiliense]
MAFEAIFDDVNFNFQVNRVLSFGDVACNREEVYAAAANIHNFETWYVEWRRMAEIAEGEGRYVHSMYYYRMAEFMLMDDDPAKNVMYHKMAEMFQKAVPSAVRYQVPFKGGHLPCLFIEADAPADTSQTVLVHGGYDSFIEEFYLICERFARAGYNVLLFEGEGQGATLRQGMTFNEKWEQSVGAILDYFQLDQVALVGISWGGYFALRAAAMEKRIAHVVCYDVCYDGLDVLFHLLPQPARTLLQQLYKFSCKRIINALVRKKMQQDTLANWGITHGMYITGTRSPFDFYRAIEKHTLKGLLNRIEQRVLLLAGEKDHYIPQWHFDYLRNHLPRARVTSRLFTTAEGGEQHCRVGNYDLAIGYILSWLHDKN